MTKEWTKDRIRMAMKLKNAELQDMPMKTREDIKAFEKVHNELCDLKEMWWDLRK